MTSLYPLNASDHLLLGCRVVEDVEDPTNYMVDHASAMVDEVAIWKWRLRDQERPFFVGGHGKRWSCSTKLTLKSGSCDN